MVSNVFAFLRVIASQSCHPSTKAILHRTSLLERTLGMSLRDWNSCIVYRDL